MAITLESELAKSPSMYSPRVEPEHDTIRGNLREVYIVTEPEVKYSSLIQAIKVARARARENA